MASGRSTPAGEWEGFLPSPTGTPEPGASGLSVGQDPLQLARVAAINSEKRPLYAVKSVDTVTQPGVPEVSGRSGHCAFAISEEDPRIFFHGGANKTGHFGCMYVLNTKLKRWSRCPLYSAPRGRAYLKTMFIRPDPRSRGKRAVPRVLSYGGIMQSKAADPEVHLLPEWGILLKGPAGANDSVPQPKGSSSEVGQARPGQRQDAWRVVPVEGDVPLARSNHAAEALGGKHVVVLGGWHGDFVSDVYVLDTEAWSWSLKGTRLSPEASLFGGMAPRAGHTVTVLPGRRLLVFGGQNNLGQLGDLWLLDTKDWVWHRPQVAGENPRKRSGHSAVYDRQGERVIFFGGWDGQQELDEVLILNTKGDVRFEWYWQKGKFDAVESAIFSENFGRVGHSATMKGDEMWVFGGHCQGKFLKDVLVIKTSMRADDDADEAEVTGAALGFVTEVLGRTQWKSNEEDDVLAGLDQKMKLAKQAMQERTGLAKRAAHQAEFKQKLEEAERRRNLMATEAYKKEEKLQKIMKREALSRREAQERLDEGLGGTRTPVTLPPHALASLEPAPGRPASSASEVSSVALLGEHTADFYAKNTEQAELALEAIAATGGLTLGGETALSASGSQARTRTSTGTRREPFLSAGKTLQRARAQQEERKALRDKATTVQPPKRRGFRPKRRTPPPLPEVREIEREDVAPALEPAPYAERPLALQIMPPSSADQDTTSVSTASAYLPLRHQQGHVPEQIEAIVIRTQAHVRGWLARRRILKARAALRMQAFARGWKERRQAGLEAAGGVSEGGGGGVGGGGVAR